MPHWPVRLSYFTTGEGERTPIYTLSFDLYENGVSGALKLDYGDFAILGDMTRSTSTPPRERRLRRSPARAARPENGPARRRA